MLLICLQIQNEIYISHFYFAPSIFCSSSANQIGMGGNIFLQKNFIWGEKYIYIK